MVWGVYGVPETFIIHNGTVIYKHIGPIHMNELEEIVLPILGKLL
jgi:cytochrome c biogenesis protein CcmG/thiol:disulfide interchange protein DsbE